MFTRGGAGNPKTGCVTGGGPGTGRKKSRKNVHRAKCRKGNERGGLEQENIPRASWFFINGGEAITRKEEEKLERHAYHRVLGD